MSRIFLQIVVVCNTVKVAIVNDDCCNVLCLQKKPLYMLPSLGCGLICIIFFLMLGTIRCIKIVTAVEEYGLTYFAMICIFNW